MKDLSKLIAVAARHTQMFYSERLKHRGVSGGQFMYIVAVCENPGETQDRLSERLIIDKSTVAKILAQLEAAGFVRRAMDANDKRALNVFPTEKAVAARLEILEIKNEWHDKLTLGLSEIERDVFEKLMEKVMENAIARYKTQLP